MIEGKYTIKVEYTITCRKGYTPYLARVEGPDGWWKEKEFARYNDAEAWCHNRLKEQGLTFERVKS